MPEESAVLGLSRPLSRTQELSIVFPVAVLVVFALALLGGALSMLTADRYAAGSGAGLLAVAFGAVLARFLRDFLPQRAWLRGSVLAVDRGGRQRQCDLATAEMVRLGSTMPPLTRGYSDAVPVLRARQRAGSPVVRLVLRGDDLRIVPASQLLLLADAIESGPAGAGHAAQAVSRLRGLAEKQAPLPVLDWSFRTDPDGTHQADR